jgi:hypothetical protein
MASITQTLRCYGGSAADWPILFGASTCPTLDQAVADHRVTYDASKAAACLADLSKQLPCASVWPPSCVPSVLVGAVADGQVCDSTYVCPLHSTCQVPTVGTDSCPMQICQHVGAAGEPCDYTCQDGATCVGGTCLANLPSGAACGAAGQASCSDELFCGPSTPGTCMPRAGEGGACADSSACWDHQYCDSTKHCHDRLGLGGDCSFDASSCQTFSACDPTTHKCVAASHLGELCGDILGIPTILCGGGVCAQDANNVGHCLTLVDDGGACAQDYECSSGKCTGGTCTPLPTNDGAACTKTEDCSSGLCDFTNGVCVAKIANGAACTDSLFCMSGFCSGGMCAAPGPIGAACTDGSGCASGHCAAGVCAACP